MSEDLPDPESRVMVDGERIVLRLAALQHDRRIDGWSPA